MGVLVEVLMEDEFVPDVFVPSTCTAAVGDDFLMSLCGLRIGRVSLVGVTALVLVRSDS